MSPQRSVAPSKHHGVCSLTIVVVVLAAAISGCCSSPDLPVASRYFDLRDPAVTLRRLIYAIEAEQWAEAGSAFSDAPSFEAPDFEDGATREKWAEIIEEHPYERPFVRARRISSGEKGRVLAELIVPHEDDDEPAYRWVFVGRWFTAELDDDDEWQWVEISESQAAEDPYSIEEWRIDAAASGTVNSAMGP